MKKNTRNLIIAVLTLTLLVSVIIFASCKRNEKYTVTFESNGGSAVESIVDVERNSLISKPVDPAKLNHTFDGWYKDANCTNVWKFETDKVTSNITLYAKWTYNETVGLNMMRNGNEYMVTGLGNVTDKDILIPEKYDGLPVTAIAQGAFKNLDSIQTVFIPDSVKAIRGARGNGVFSDCKNLTSVSLPSGLTAIEEETFFGCNKLTDVKIPSGVTSIGNLAFSGCASLTSVTLPAGLDELGENAFSGCIGIESLSIESGSNSKYVSSVNGVQTNCIIEVVSSDVNKLVIGCKKSVIPTIAGRSMVIGSGAFYGCSELNSITIPQSVTEIEEGAFNGCGLISIIIPSSVKKIGDRAFSLCTSLSTVTFSPLSGDTPDEYVYGIESLGQEAFSYCYDLTAIHLPKSLESIGRGLLYESGGSITMTITTDHTSNNLRNIISLPIADEKDPYINPLTVICFDTDANGVAIMGLA